MNGSRKKKRRSVPKKMTKGKKLTQVSGTPSKGDPKHRDPTSQSGNIAKEGFQQNAVDRNQKQDWFQQIAKEYGNETAQCVLNQKSQANEQEDETTQVLSRLDRGRPLEGAKRQEMESGLGTPVGDVEIHTGANASQLASEQKARAFTIGNQVVFGAGEYNPGTLEGNAILAHELAHVVQQRGADPNQRNHQPSEASLEQDADQAVIGLARERFGSMKEALAGFPKLARARLQSGVHIARCAIVGKTDEEKKETWEDVKWVLDLAEVRFDNAGSKFPDERYKDKAKEVSGWFYEINGILEEFDVTPSMFSKVMEWLFKAMEISEFLEAFNEFSAVDPKENPEEFAKAAGIFLAEAGDIMSLLGIPGLDMYGKFLSEAGGFFTNFVDVHMGSETSNRETLEKAFESGPRGK